MAQDESIRTEGWTFKKNNNTNFDISPNRVFVKYNMVPPDILKFTCASCAVQLPCSIQPCIQT